MINENFLFNLNYLILFLSLSKNSTLSLGKDIFNDSSFTFSDDFITI